MGRRVKEKLLPMRDKSAPPRPGIRRGLRPRQMCDQPHDQRRLGPPHLLSRRSVGRSFPSEITPFDDLL